MVSFSLEVFLKNWVVHKGTVQRLLPESDPCKTELATHALARCIAFQVMYDHESEAGARGLDLTVFPTAAYAKESFDRFELRLAPLTTLSKVLMEKCAGSIVVTVKDMKVYVCSPPTPTTADANKEFMMSPFWYVINTQDEERANMRYASLKVGQTNGTVLQNSKKLNAGDCLCVYKEPLKEQSLKGRDEPKPTTGPSGDVEHNSGASARAPKRAVPKRGSNQPKKKSKN